MENHTVLNLMITIYKPLNKDWMGYSIQKTKGRNSKMILTFHHINEERKGGKATLENGAILSSKAHKDLHTLEFRNYELYQKWTNLFIEINQNKGPLTSELEAKREHLLKETKIYLKELEEIKIRSHYETKENPLKNLRLNS